MFFQYRHALCVKNVGIYFITEGKYAFWNLWSLFFTLPLLIEMWKRKDFAFLFKLFLTESRACPSQALQEWREAGWAQPARALASAGGFQMEISFCQKSSTHFLNVGNSYREKKNLDFVGRNRTQWACSGELSAAHQSAVPWLLATNALGSPAAFLRVRFRWILTLQSLP